MTAAKLQVVPTFPAFGTPLPTNERESGTIDSRNPASPDFDFWAAPKPLQDKLRAEGVPIPPHPEELKKRAEAAKRATGKSPRRGTAGKRKKGDSDVVLAKAVVEEFSGPLAFVGGNFWTFSVERGWEICDRRVENAAHDKLNRNADNALIPIIRSRVALPSQEETATAPVYWERIGGRWEGSWEPLALSDDELLYTDSIYSLSEGEATTTRGRIIWGPMISTPWETEEDPPNPAEFEAFVAERIPDAGIRRHFQEVMATVLQPHVILRGQIVLWGPPKCGKTTLCMAISCAPAGAIGVAQQQEVDLVKNKWSRNQLVNRFVNISDDSVRVAQWTGFVKRYTSGVLIAEPKYGKPATMAATAKLISTCNEMQDTADASGAMVDRLFPFKIEQRVEGNENPELMSIQHWTVPFRRAEIVEWLVEGLTRARKRGKFAPPQNWLQDKLEAVSAGDPVEAWISDNLCKSTDEGMAIRLSEIVQKIPSSIVSMKNARHLEMTLGTYLRRLFNSEKSRIMKDGERHIYYSGIAWK